MIGYLRGQVLHLLPEYCLLDVGGVGYRVFVAGATRSRLKLGEEAAFFTHLAVREDALTLYGFSTVEEYDFFQLLISVSGIGPKVAQNALAASTVDAICRAIRDKQVKSLMKLPGIGKKTAERLILELKDKIVVDDNDEPAADDDYFAVAPSGDDKAAEARSALEALGYSPGEITPILKKIGRLPTVEAMVKAALKEFLRGN